MSQKTILVANKQFLVTNSDPNLHIVNQLEESTSSDLYIPAFQMNQMERPSTVNEATYYTQIESIPAMNRFLKQINVADLPAVLRFQRKISDSNQFGLFIEDCLVFEEIFGEIKSIDVKQRQIAEQLYLIVLITFTNRVLAHLELNIGSDISLQAEWNGQQNLIVFDSLKMEGFKTSSQKLSDYPFSLNLSADLIAQQTYSKADLQEKFDKWHQLIARKSD